MEIRPVRNEQEHHQALQEIEKLMGAQPGTPEEDRLEVLVTLVEAYEMKYYPIPLPTDPVEVLEYYMESRGLSRADLVPYLGSKERVSDILNHRRSLSLNMIRKLHEGLQIPCELLIGSQVPHSTRSATQHVVPN